MFGVNSKPWTKVRASQNNVGDVQPISKSAHVVQDLEHTVAMKVLGVCAFSQNSSS